MGGDLAIWTTYRSSHPQFPPAQLGMRSYLAVIGLIGLAAAASAASEPAGEAATVFAALSEKATTAADNETVAVSDAGA